ncbi:MAG: glycoside hydrolase family 2 TIM barrel-domain containing protein, partial [Bacteroidota bacterium]
YGGITRDVWLIEYPQVYLEDIVWTTPVLNEEEATIQFSGALNVSKSLVEPEIVVELLSPNEEVVAKNRFELLREELVERDGSFTLPSFPLNNPALWSPETPNLYTARISLMAGEKELDTQRRKLGLRWFSFSENGAFTLNGQKLLLRGTHRHEEHAGYGAAMPDSLHRKDMELIKEMGANFVRLGHYPQDPEVYRACDELGLIVWDELPWCRGGMGGEEWKTNTRRLLQEQILQNRQYTSICFWSLGNEIYWLPDFPGGDDPEKLNAFLQELNDLAHELDPSRLTAIRKYYEGADLVDVFSPSIWAGWYAGVYTNYESALERERKKYPNMLHMEYGGSSHVGRHTETPVTGDGLLSEEEWAEVANQVSVKNIAKEGDWTENYIVDLFDWHLSVSEAFPDFAGNAQWAFKDFGTPLRPENAIPYVNQKGLLDRAGNPKDSYYVFKSYWSEEPFVYIESHTWTERAGPKGKNREVSVYSNCPEVELFHDGISLGKRAFKKGNFPAHNLRWQVPFSEGTNELLAVGYVGEEVSFTDSLRLNYRYEPAGKPHHISLQASPVERGTFLVEATMVDQEGNRVLTYEDKVYFSLNGQGQLMVKYGTPTGSQVIEMANGRAAIEVLLPEGKAVIEARNQDFKGSYLTIEAEK